MGASGPRLQARAAGGWPLEWGHDSLAECSVLCRGVFVRTRARGWANEASMRSHIDSHSLAVLVLENKRGLEIWQAC